MNNKSDTICAISTPLGMGGIGIVRLSGPNAVGIASQIFRKIDDKVGYDYQSHTITYGHVVNLVDGGVVDEGLLTVMRAPRTYTREDVAEINCHGGPAAVRKVLELAASAGARLAEPGEFTRRAFMNGRIDLTQAEAVMDLIASKSELSLKAAVSQLGGGLRERVEALRETLTEVLALTEVSIDFPDEELDYVPLAGLREKGRAASDAVRGLLSTYHEGRVLRDGIRVAIVGRPNVGKSSLLNLLTRSERAIVTEVPGTTRDTVEEFITLGGVPVKVIDTAGIREGRDAVEREGIRRSEEALRQSDIALLVLDGSLDLTDEDRVIIEKVNDCNYIVVINKSDLPQRLVWTAVASRTMDKLIGAAIPSPVANVLADTTVPSEAVDIERKNKLCPVHVVANNPPAGEGMVVSEIASKACEGTAAPVRMSAKTGAGLDDLIRRVKDAVLSGGRDRPPEAVINLRHKEALARAEAALVRFDAGCGDGLSPEFLALEAREALDAVGEVVGTTTPEDVLNRIFSSFCIGK